jgi:hypothetical protein
MTYILICEARGELQTLLLKEHLAAMCQVSAAVLLPPVLQPLLSSLNIKGTKLPKILNANTMIPKFTVKM